MRADLLSGAKQFVNVALPVPDMNEPIGGTETFRRLLEIVQPADAFLLFDRYASGQGRG